MQSEPEYYQINLKYRRKFLHCAPQHLLQMLLKQLLIVCLLCVTISYTHAQDTILPKDSLETILNKASDHYYDYQFKNAIETSSLLIEEAKKANNSYYTFRGYIELGIIHYSIKDTSKSRFYYRKALEKAIDSKVDTLISWAYNDLGNSYAEDEVYYQKGIDYYAKGIEINRRIGAPDVKNIAQYMNIAWTYLDMGAFEEAWPYLQKAQKVSKEREQSPLLYLNLNILFGRYYHYVGRDQDAVTILKQAARAAEEGNHLEQAAESNKYLAIIYEGQNKLALANASLKKQQQLNEKIHAAENEAAIMEASAKLGVQEYQKDLEIAQKEQVYSEELIQKSRLLSTIFLIATIILVLALGAFFMLFRARKRYIRDLSEKNIELTLAKEKAEKLSKLKTQFFSTVSHELRTPLYGVIGLSSILLENEGLKAHSDDLKSLKFSADYLLALINDVLILNKMDANGIQLEHTPFALDTLLNGIIRSFSFSLEQNNNTIHLHIEDGIPNRLLGDSVRLSQILMNLVGNAVKFNENGNIDLYVRLVGNDKPGAYRTEFVIKDDGIGIPKDKQQSIFEEFSQIENNNYNYQGTGLGLPIVRKLLALYNSEIHVESVVGEGSTFSFTITLEADPSYDVGELFNVNQQQVIFEEPIYEHYHVLIVDDNKINQKITQKILETRHFSCSIADSGEEAIEMVKKHNYNLVLMDIHMPGMGGVKATEAIRIFNKQVPIIALTAVEADEIRDKIRASGMNDIILKPYDISRFLSTILKNINRELSQQF